MQLRTDSGKTAYTGLLAALALVFSYVETLIPLNFGIPGVKIGLANIAGVVTLYLFGLSYAFLVQVLRVVISGLLFGNLYGIIYSMTGAVLSIVIMYLLKKTDRFSVIGVSIAGGVTHNIGQLFVAIITVSQLKLSLYGPVLIISGVIMGAITGFVCIPVLKVLKHMFDSGKI